MAEPTLLHEVVELMREGIAQPRLLWQLAVVAAGLGGGWALARRVRHRIEGRIASESQGPGLRTDVLRFSFAGVRRLAFPVAAMLMTRSVRGIFLISILIGLLVPGVGLVVAFLGDFPASPAIVAVALVILGAAWLSARVRGH